MIESTGYLQKMLAKSEEKLKNANNELKHSPKGYLSIVKRGKAYSYFQVEVKDGRRIRKSISKDDDCIVRLVRKAYIIEEIKLLKKNIAALSTFISRYGEPTVEAIIAGFPKGLARLPEKYRRVIVDESFSCGGMNRSQTEWMLRPYRQSAYMPEKKIHTTSRGLKVRSKSELLIAEKLYEHGVPFRYEQVIDIGGIEYAPDFTIMTPDGRTVYWEHCGLPGNQEYMKRHKRKLESYEEVGIVPWENLIVTYDDENGILNLAIVESEIANKIK